MVPSPAEKTLAAAYRTYVEAPTGDGLDAVLDAERAWLAEQSAVRLEERVAVGHVAEVTTGQLAERGETLTTAREVLRVAEQALAVAKAERDRVGREVQEGAVQVFTPGDGPDRVVTALGPNLRASLADATDALTAAELARSAASAGLQNAGRLLLDALTQHRRAVKRLADLGGPPEPAKPTRAKAAA